MNSTINIVGAIRTAIAEVLMFVFAGVTGALVVIAAPILAIAAPIYAMHTGDAGNIRLVSELYILLGPLSASFYFSCIWKGMRRDSFVSGLVGAAGRMLLGFAFSVGCMLLVGLKLHAADASMWFATMYVAISAPVLVLAATKLALRGKAESCVLCGAARFKPSCPACGADYSVV